MAKCSKCGVELTLENGRIRNKDKGWFYSWCKACHNKQTRESKQARKLADPVAYAIQDKINRQNRDRRKEQESQKQWRIDNPVKVFTTRLKVYNLSLGDYETLKNSQNNVCAACEEEFDSSKREPQVDHDHSCCPKQESCGKCVRGLLCRKCNLTLGNSEESSKRLQGLLSYLEKWKGIENVK